MVCRAMRSEVDAAVNSATGQVTSAIFKKPFQFARGGNVSTSRLSGLEGPQPAGQHVVQPPKYRPAPRIAGQEPSWAIDRQSQKGCPVRRVSAPRRLRPDPARPQLSLIAHRPERFQSIGVPSTEALAFDWRHCSIAQCERAKRKSRASGSIAPSEFAIIHIKYMFIVFLRTCGLFALAPANRAS